MRSCAGSGSQVIDFTRAPALIGPIKMKLLWPPLGVIEENLFGPSEELLMRLAANDPTVPADLRRAVESDPDAMAAVRELENAGTKSGEVESGDTQIAEPLPEVPDFIRLLIERRAAAHGAKFSPIPRTGQIVAVEQVIGPEGDLGTDLARPIAALLDRESRTPNVWRGWMVSPEIDYATCWDVLLEPEDEPFDPLAAMVQVWNPVHVYIPSVAGRVLGELKPARMQAVRAMAEDLLFGAEPDPAKAQPGSLVTRVLAGELAVLSGTPLRGPDDPRWRYQQIYHAAGEALREPARQAVRAAQSSVPDWVGDLWRRILEKAESIGQALTLVPALAHLGDEESAPLPTFKLAERLLLTLDQQREDAVQLHVQLAKIDESLTVSLMEDGLALQHYRLHVAEPGADFFLDPARDYTLVARDRDGNAVCELPIPSSSA